MEELTPSQSSSHVLGTYAEVCSKAQPPEVRYQGPRRNFVHLGPDVRKVAHCARQCNDVHCGLDGSFQGEEQGHPNEVQSKLYSV